MGKESNLDVISTGRPFSVPTLKNVQELTRFTQDQIGDNLLIVTV